MSEVLNSQPESNKRSVEDDAATDAKKIKLCLTMPKCQEFDDIQTLLKSGCPDEAFDIVNDIDKLPPTHQLRQKMEAAGMFQASSIMKNLLSSIALNTTDDGNVQMSVNFGALKSMVDFSGELNQKLGIPTPQQSHEDAKKAMEAFEHAILTAKEGASERSHDESLIAQTEQTIDKSLDEILLSARRLQQLQQGPTSAQFENQALDLLTAQVRPNPSGDNVLALLAAKQQSTQPTNPIAEAREQMVSALHRIPTTKKLIKGDDPIVQAHLLSADDIFNEGLYELCWHRHYLLSLTHRVGPAIVVTYDEKQGSLARCADFLRRIVEHKELTISFYDNVGLVTTDPVVALEYVKNVSADKLPLFLEFDNEYSVEELGNTILLRKKIGDYQERITRLKAT